VLQLTEFINFIKSMYNSDNFSELCGKGRFYDLCYCSLNIHAYIRPCIKTSRLIKSRDLALSLSLFVALKMKQKRFNLRDNLALLGFIEIDSNSFFLTEIKWHFNEMVSKVLLIVNNLVKWTHLVSYISNKNPFNIPLFYLLFFIPFFIKLSGRKIQKVDNFFLLDIIRIF
jgi:hypothetical protein